MRTVSKLEMLVLPTVTLSAMLGLLTAPTSSDVSPLGVGTACAAETCCKQEEALCVTSQGSFEDRYGVEGSCPPIPPQN
jgi:hypothetical protein